MICVWSFPFPSVTINLGVLLSLWTSVVSVYIVFLAPGRNTLTRQLHRDLHSHHYLSANSHGISSARKSKYPSYSPSLSLLLHCLLISTTWNRIFPLIAACKAMFQSWQFAEPHSFVIVRYRYYNYCHSHHYHGIIPHSPACYQPTTIVAGVLEFPISPINLLIVHWKTRKQKPVKIKTKNI